MLLWIKDNIGSIIISLGLLAIVVGIVISLIQRKKAGKCIGCDCCAQCPKKGCPSQQSKEANE